ncbi:aminoacyl-tRNA hydrolase [Clavibacter michiganensis]|uniref:Peptidyl-tRNA hydrolase n=1 Tax=Clavibacter michiganensis subsp. insidiosus TaxID=33014 RepID=A0A0D5CIR1_9MICO|nr:aminoacyl-tRNA hydrolase [Clavibacter michiganensis]AJW79521.1 peptidyl-tRNA hydrolase [Clavibacter michiganensis subsp. insidiosus]AWF97727.1 aminoacyl-tRNA hydrolase [Clavibacter michiganensis subsp. insidiosus]AWG02073.1 aminoacyl-tRNA hydrolase [Clavibacter michiganensis subsp. insidiosus]OQJ59442.1 aminoacyl-tRNA hydrolase [Clavibacter michiganensis subsp. insidiosus]RII88320.1 aminoacyl-tRNA hydrolase [Clavibacter michiganensis subsp. insidiosus]
MDDRTLLVVGLGNPGPQYAGTRHNVGQMALDVLADRMRATFRSHRANAQVAEGRAVPGGPKLILAKPSSFMNLSGGPVANLLKYFSLEPAQLVVAHDELDIPFDSMKLKQGGGHGGHNGIRDIISSVGTGDFTRVRIGIGRPPGRQDAADFVLKPFSSTERQVLPNVLEDAADAVEMIAADGLIAAQLRFHTAAS